MPPLYHIYGSAKIGMRTSNQALLEVFPGLLKITTFQGVFLFEQKDIVKIFQRKFLLGLFRSVKIQHSKKEYSSQIFFHIPPFTGDNFQRLKKYLNEANLPVI